jgi:hypothetical protein
MREHRAGGSEGTQPHTRSFSSVSRLREAANASWASELTGGGVVLLKEVRRGELSEAETRGLIAERAVAPLVIVVEEDVDGGRREEDEGGALWGPEDISTLCALCPPSRLPSLTRHVYRTSMAQPESLDQVKFPSKHFHTHLPYS